MSLFGKVKVQGGGQLPKLSAGRFGLKLDSVTQKFTQDGNQEYFQFVFEVTSSNDPNIPVGFVTEDVGFLVSKHDLGLQTIKSIIVASMGLDGDRAADQAEINSDEIDEHFALMKSNPEFFHGRVLQVTGVDAMSKPTKSKPVPTPYVRRTYRPLPESKSVATEIAKSLKGSKK